MTGVAGFIGSNLADQLIANGWFVRGADRFTAYYEERAKRANLEALMNHERFELVECDLGRAPLEPLLADSDVVFHLSGQPGVRLSWADGFETYVDLNVLVTQRLLEAVRSAQIKRVVFASSSSIYGEASTAPTTEDAATRPHSPYGVTKLAAEQLCSAYAANFGVPVVSLRYFTVYGPRQRPDMAFHRLIDAVLRDEPFPVYGDGLQVRDFTFVGDVVAATELAATQDVPPGTVFNVCGGSATTLLDAIDEVARLGEREVKVEWRPAQPGDVRATGGSNERARRMLHWSPTTSVGDGLAAQFRWQHDRLVAWPREEACP